MHESRVKSAIRAPHQSLLSMREKLAEIVRVWWVHIWNQFLKISLRLGAIKMRRTAIMNSWHFPFYGIADIKLAPARSAVCDADSLWFSLSSWAHCSRFSVWPRADVRWRMQSTDLFTRTSRRWNSSVILFLDALDSLSLSWRHAVLMFFSLLCLVCVCLHAFDLVIIVVLVLSFRTENKV
jgi:hypothetical protein